MATFEKRKNVDGKVTAIRVKIRRVGLPHLSQTFPVLGDSPSALKKAEKAAKAWADEVSKGLNIQHGNIKSVRAQFNPLGMQQQQQIDSETLVHIPFERIISKDQGDYFIFAADTSQARVLAALMLDCGLGMEEVARLRWQHVLLNQKCVEVFGQSGIFQRQAPLTEVTIEMLLAHNQRKYGLMFNEAESVLYQQLPPALIGILQQKSNIPIGVAFKQEAAHRMVDKGVDETAICANLGIKNLQALNIHLKSAGSSDLKAY